MEHRLDEGCNMERKDFVLWSAESCGMEPGKVSDVLFGVCAVRLTNMP